MPPKVISNIAEKKKRWVPKPFIQPEWLAQYILERDRAIYKDPKTCQQTKDELKERYKK